MNSTTLVILAVAAVGIIMIMGKTATAAPQTSTAAQGGQAFSFGLSVPFKGL